MRRQLTKENILKLFFTLLGIVGLYIILRDYGFNQVIHDFQVTGFNIIWILLSFLPVAYCYGLSWQLVSDYKKFQHNFFYNSLLFTTYAIISIAWNNLTPFLKIGGEPVKYMLLKKHLNMADALKSTVNYNLIHIISTLLSLILFSLLIPILFKSKASYFFLSIGLGISLLLFIVIYLALHLSKMKKEAPVFLKKILIKRKVRVTLFILKRSIRRLHFHYKRQPLQVLLSIFFDTLARFIEGMTFYLAFLFIGHSIPFLVSVMLDVGRTFIDTFFFFIPYQIGAREEGVRFFMENIFHIQSLGFVTVVLLYRIVEIFWIIIGYLMWLVIHPKHSK